MVYFTRQLEQSIQYTLKRGKSILLLGARQTGKTTLIERLTSATLSYSLVQVETRLRYEKNPALLAQEIMAAAQTSTSKLCVFIDEIQKLPLLLDSVQDLIDRNIAQFILTGSSARKLKHGTNINLLPGRVVQLQLDPLILAEIPHPLPPIEQLLFYGSLPATITTISSQDKETDLRSYVGAYLEEEIRAEAMVRNVGVFTRFLELAAIESGNLINFKQLSQDIGVARQTIAEYYQILEDCLIVEKITPLTKSKTRRLLSKANKYIFFDTGVRRLCANEGIRLPPQNMGMLFEQWAGLELSRISRLAAHAFKVHYWRAHSGPEVDYVLAKENNYIAIEVKWTATPSTKDCRHLKLFLSEYGTAKQGFIICNTPKKLMLTENIMAIPWQEIQFCCHHFIDN